MANGGPPTAPGTPEELPNLKSPDRGEAGPAGRPAAGGPSGLVPPTIPAVGVPVGSQLRCGKGRKGPRYGDRHLARPPARGAAGHESQTLQRERMILAQ